MIDWDRKEQLVDEERMADTEGGFGKKEKEGEYERGTEEEEAGEEGVDEEETEDGSGREEMEEDEKSAEKGRTERKLMED